MEKNNSIQSLYSNSVWPSNLFFIWSQIWNPSIYQCNVLMYTSSFNIESQQLADDKTQSASQWWQHKGQRKTVLGQEDSTKLTEAHLPTSRSVHFLPAHLNAWRLIDRVGQLTWRLIDTQLVQALALLLNFLDAMTHKSTPIVQVSPLNKPVSCQDDFECQVEQ